MWYYVNPKKMSKEDFLKKYALEISREAFLNFSFKGFMYPACLVDTGKIQALGVTRSSVEAHEIDALDYPKKYYLLSEDVLSKPESGVDKGLHKFLSLGD